MAVDLFSDTGPRISFSHDFCQTDVVPVERRDSRHDSSLLDSNADFVFCAGGQAESSSADMLFSNGVILPTRIQSRPDPSIEIRKHENPRHVSHPLPTPAPPPPGPSAAGNSKKESVREITITSFDADEKPQSKSFWPFRRSSSLNCDNSNYRPGLSICSLQLLSRSNSTGSVPNSKRTPAGNRSSSHKQPLVSAARTSVSSSSSSCPYSYSSWQKPPLKKSYGGSYGHGISPVLNVPPPYLSRGTTTLFGFGSFFRNGKDKRNKR